MSDKSGDCRAISQAMLEHILLCDIYAGDQPVSNVLEKIKSVELSSFTCVFVYSTEDFEPQNVYFETGKGDGPLNLS